MATPVTKEWTPAGTGDVLVKVEDGLGWITFSNPSRRNAMSGGMWESLIRATESLESDPGVRVVVLRGAGSMAFVSGADISELAMQRSEETRTQHSDVVARAERSIARITKPVVAMIQGFCIGAGVVLAVDADVRIAAASARFAIPAAKLGLAFEQRAVAALARLVGPSVAADLLFSARFLDAAAALGVGLVNVVVEDDRLEEAVLAYARGIAMNAPMSVLAAKAAIRLHASDRPSDGERETVKALALACFESQDFVEGRRAFLEKRAPRFIGS